MRRVVVMAHGLKVRAAVRLWRLLLRFRQNDASTVFLWAEAAYPLECRAQRERDGAPEAMRSFGRQAAGNGVRRLVLLSGRGEPEAVVAEGALRESGLDMTVVRASFFAQNFSEGAMSKGVLTGEIPFPAGETAEPFIDADDLADVVVAALTEDGHTGLVHELTGPRLLTFAEVAAEIGRATGRDVRYVPVSDEAYAEMLQQYGLPAPDAQWLAGLFGMLLDGHNASLTNGVRQVLGREPKDFADFARRTAESGAWNA
jgi:uncharacterized protein YbjT (DUF2867 family)